jgi:hypothetical protein
MMESSTIGKLSVDIGKTMEKYADIIKEILPVHALTRCDTVACSYGLGKGVKG